MQTINPTENTWVIAGNGVDLFLPGLVQPGEEYVTGQPIVEQFTNRDSFLSRLDELSILYEENDYVPEIKELTPDWDAFNAYMLSDATFKSYRDTVRPLDGDLTSALFTAYNRVASDGVTAFSLVWGQWCSVSGITAEDREVIAGVAEGFSLPADFVAIVRGSTPWRRGFARATI